MNIEALDVVILCGGLGTRLRSSIGESQKVMADVNGKPFLDFHVEHLKKQGVERIILCTGYKREEVENYYRANETEIAIDFAREFEPLGTGGAIKNAEPLIESDPFVVLNGDSFCPFDLNELLDQYFKQDKLAAIAVAEKKDASDYGTIALDDSNGITAFKEKQSDVSGFVNAGIYCFSGEIFLSFPHEDKFSLEHDVFPKLAEDSQMVGVKVKDEFYDIGTPEKYKAFSSKQ